jgi:hypothetical protein
MPLLPIDALKVASIDPNQPQTNQHPLRRPPAHHREIRTWCNSALPTERANTSDQDRHLNRTVSTRARGVAAAPAGFGEFAGALLIGNFGNGHINAFDPGTGEFLGKVRKPPGSDYRH